MAVRLNENKEIVAKIKEGLKAINSINDMVNYKFPNNFIVQFLLGGFSKLIFDYALVEKNLTEKELMPENAKCECGCTEFFQYFDKLFYSLLKSEIFFEMK